MKFGSGLGTCLLWSTGRCNWSADLGRPVPFNRDPRTSVARGVGCWYGRPGADTGSLQETLCAARPPSTVTVTDSTPGMKLVWQRLIRFETPDGRILRGEPILPSPEFDIGLAEASDLLHAKVISGGDIFATDGTTVVTDEIVPVNRVLGPLTQEDVPILRCVGLNYAKHGVHPAR